MKNIWITIVLGFVYLLMNGCAGWAPYYQIDPIEAQVVDAETGEPIEGANVIAHWQLVVGGLDGPSNSGQLEVKETVTDKDGRFSFDGFTRPNLVPLVELRDEDPAVIIFKPGYKHLRISNEYPRAGTLSPGIHRTWQWNGKQIGLRRIGPIDEFIGDQYAEVAYIGLETDLHLLIYSPSCPRIMAALVAMNEERKRLKAISRRARVDLPELSELPAWCRE